MINTRKFVISVLLAMVLCFVLSGFVVAAVTPMIDGGTYHTIYLRADGTVWAWGRNNYGQLGIGSTADSWIPVQVDNLTNVVAISANSYHNLALKSDGTVWTWGYNGYGQLGDGTTITRRSPIKVPGLYGIEYIAAGGTHGLAAKSSTVYSWGSNSAGQLGNGTTTSSKSPVTVSMTQNITGLSAGFKTSYALLSTGRVFAWGNDNYGQVGNGSNDTVVIDDPYPGPYSSSPKSSYQINATTSTYITSPVSVSNLTNAVALVAGNNHALALTSTGTVKAWGYNYYGQLGDGTKYNRISPVSINMSNVIKIGAGANHSFAIQNGNAAYSWGYNYYGQLGDGSTTLRTTPVRISNLFALSISGGTYHSFAVNSDGWLYGWGSNSYGQLGDGDTTNHYSPHRVSERDVKTGYNAGQVEIGNYGYQAANGTYVIGANTQPLNSTQKYKQVVFTVTHGGDVLSAKAYGDDNSELITVKETLGNDTIVAAQTNFVDDKGDSLLYKVHESGNVIWAKIYHDIFIEDVEPTNDGGYIVLAAYKISPIFCDTILFKLDSQGYVEWSKKITINGPEIPKALSVAKDGGYYIGISYKDDTNSEVAESLIWKFDSSGNPEWGRLFGATNDFYLVDVATSNDWGVVFGGNYNNTTALIKLNSSGYIQWERYYDSGYVSSINAAENGDYVLVGRQTNNGQADSWISVVDFQGYVIESQVLGETENNHFTGVSVTSNGYLAVGSYGDSDSDAFVMSYSDKSDALLTDIYGTVSTNHILITENVSTNYVFDYVVNVTSTTVNVTDITLSTTVGGGSAGPWY